MDDNTEITYVSADDPNCIEMIVGTVINWHSKGMENAKHLLDVPEDTETIIVIEGVETPLKLSGDIRKAFIAGVITAVSAFNDLPFIAVDPEGETNESQTNTIQ